MKKIDIALFVFLLALGAGMPSTFVGFEPLPKEAPAPPDNPTTPEKVALGKLLYFDNRLSGDLSTPCAGCHFPALGWGDMGQLSRGYPGSVHWRNSQTVMNSGFYAKLFWQGSSLSLESQAKGAATGNLAGNVDTAMAEERMAQVPHYVDAFKSIWGVNRPSFELAMKAIAAFERTIVSWDTPFDNWLRGNQELPEDAERGLELFVGKAGCALCHNGMLLSDERYHDLGVPENPLFTSSPLHQITLRYQHFGKGVHEEDYRGAHTDYGLYYTTKIKSDKGKFRTPGLRYIAFSGPFMHNGVFGSLEEVVDFYDSGGGQGINKSPLMRPLNLTGEEKSDLIAFLHTLSPAEPILMGVPTLPPYAPTEE
ncbi:cytochrome-c peroxidase [bacterium]|nr:cytochrome-c peroxidase [bacterium]